MVRSLTDAERSFQTVATLLLGGESSSESTDTSKVSRKMKSGGSGKNRVAGTRMVVGPDPEMQHLNVPVKWPSLSTLERRVIPMPWPDSAVDRWKDSKSTSLWTCHSGGKAVMTQPCE
jgi:hypothetical protein